MYLGIGAARGRRSGAGRWCSVFGGWGRAIGWADHVFGRCSRVRCGSCAGDSRGATGGRDLLVSRDVETLVGTITSLGFVGGHRFVVGDWASSPVGAFSDVMWARPSGDRVLLAPERAAEFVTSVYPFDDVRCCVVTVASDSRGVAVDAGGLALRVVLGRVAAPFPRRPRWVTATVENWVARLLLGVRTYGVSPTGVTEWYRTRSLRFVESAYGSLEGRDLGALCAVERPVGFGFTDPPRRPARTSLRVDLRRPSV